MHPTQSTDLLTVRQKTYACPMKKNCPMKIPDDGADADKLIRIADERMYQQKQLLHSER